MQAFRRLELLEVGRQLDDRLLEAGHGEQERTEEVDAVGRLKVLKYIVVGEEVELPELL